MAAERQGAGLFREKSLERLSSPERLDQLLVVADRRSFVPLAALGTLIVGIAVWSACARVPVHVEGRGILVRPRKIVEFQAPGAGRVAGIDVEIGQHVRRGERLARIERPDLEKQLALEREKRAQLLAESERAEGAGRGGSGGAFGLRAQIERSRALAERLRAERLGAIEEEERRSDRQAEVAQNLSDALRERLEDQRRLAASGLVAKVDLDRTETDYLESLESLAEVENERGTLRAERLQADEQYFDRLQKIAEWDFEFGQRIAEVERGIARLEQQAAEESQVRSDHEGRILELNVAIGTFLAAGERVGSMEVVDAADDFESVTYFRVKDGKRLHPRMKIKVTPDTVRRERYGSIVGEIQTVSTFPVSLEQATVVIGNRVVAESLIGSGYLIEVTATLERSPEGEGRFVWTSSQGPEDVVVSGGTTATARVAVARERPIAFVLPMLRSATGLE